MVADEGGELGESESLGAVEPQAIAAAIAIIASMVTSKRGLKLCFAIFTALTSK